MENLWLDYFRYKEIKVIEDCLSKKVAILVCYRKVLNVLSLLMCRALKEGYEENFVEDQDNLEIEDYIFILEAIQSYSTINKEI